MTLRIGIDLVPIPRFEHLLRRGGVRFSVRLFTDAEWAADGGSPKHLAQRLAAKEAVAKALGVGLAHLSSAGVPATEIELVMIAGRTPQVRLHGRAAALMREQGMVGFEVSLSQTSEAALAVALGVFPAAVL